jgi:hypothetical protein
LDGHGKDVADQELLESLGWARGRRGAIAASAAVFLALTAIHARVTYASVMIAHVIVARGRTPVSGPEQQTQVILIGGAMLLQAAYLICVWFWFRTYPVPDHYRVGEASPGLLTRRDAFVSATVPVLALVAAAISWSKVRQRLPMGKAQYLATHAKVPRFRKRRSDAAGQLPQPGVYRNQRSAVLHIFTANERHRHFWSRMRSVKQESVDALFAMRAAGRRNAVLGSAAPATAVARPQVAVSAQPVRSSRLHRADVSRLEGMAIEAVHAKQYQTAARLLSLGIANSPRNIRFYDLLAGISVRYKEGWDSNAAYRNAIAQAADLRAKVSREASRPPRKRARKRHAHVAPRQFRPTPKGVHPVSTATLDQYLLKWQDQKGVWYKQWADPKIEVRWAGLVF